MSGAVAPVRRRSPVVAAVLSIVPGLGQLYTGHARKALFFLVTTALAMVPAIALITSGEHVGKTLLDSHRFALFLVVAFLSVLVFLVLFVLGLFLWASAAVDAWHTARAVSEGRAGSGRRFFRL